jgi:VanZ family protein
MALHKTSAWPMAWVYAGLIVYASLYPFSDWRDQGIVPWDFLWAAWPRYWTGFDLVSNVLGYAPLGFLLCLSALRSGHPGLAIVRSGLFGLLLSLLMESLQVYLPSRVPSNVDLLTNAAGAFLGAMTARGLENMGAIARWNRFRARWFLPDARGGMVLLALWPIALLFPAAVPLGLGQVFERVEAALSGVLSDTPFLEWLPLRAVELQPLVPGAELSCVFFGALIPCLLGFCIIRAFFRRLIFVVLILAMGLVASTLSAALSYGPEHAWAWLSLPAQLGFVGAGLVAMFCLAVPARASAALVLVVLGIYISVINQAPTSTYFEQTLQTWEQGRFIRFHGVVQWLGWIWPYAAMIYVLTRVWGHDVKN